MELSKQELDTLARLAHDLGGDVSDTCERSQEEIEQIGTETLARLIASMRQKAIADLFACNFHRGWMFRQTDSREWEERKIGG